MTEEKKYTRRKASKLTTIRNISPSIDGPVRILGIVIDSSPGSALIQDIYDSDIDNAGRIWVGVEGTLEVKKKYMIIGEVTIKTVDEKEQAWLNATIAHDIETLDIGTFKEVIEMEDAVRKTMIG